MTRGAARAIAGDVGLSDDMAAHWAWRAAALVVGVALARLAVLSFGAPPLHFDEAQYWTYGEALDFGYYSKPPMVAWLIRASSAVFGDGPFGVRFFSPLLHSWIAWLLFAVGRRLFDGRTGFWAAAVYLAMPGVTWSSALMTTDPPMMAAWGAALYALVRAIEPPAAAGAAGTERLDDKIAAGGGRWLWWLLLGAAIGAGLLGKYTIIAFVGGALGYALFSREGRWGYRSTRLWGPLLAAVAAVVVWGPNLWWNATNGFASILHVADNTKLGGGATLRPEKAAEFIGAQFALAGPVLPIAGAALLLSGRWRVDWGYRLLLWLSAPLVLTISVVAFLTRAHPNWAAPAYLALCLAAVAFLLDREARGWVFASIGVGVAAAAALTAGLWIYETRGPELPRLYDIAKKMRPFPPVCDRALALAPDAGRAAPFLSADRRILGVCLNRAGAPLETGGRMWRPPHADAGNHYALKGPLLEDAPEPPAGYVLAMTWPEATAESMFFGRFDRVEVLEAGELRTHADRTEPYIIARLSGFRGYKRVADAENE